MSLDESYELAKKLAINLILMGQSWFPSHIDTRTTEITQNYEKYYQKFRSKELFV
jgi:hypothetical protein